MTPFLKNFQTNLGQGSLINLSKNTDSAEKHEITCIQLPKINVCNDAPHIELLLQTQKWAFSSLKTINLLLLLICFLTTCCIASIVFRFRWQCGSGFEYFVVPRHGSISAVFQSSPIRKCFAFIFALIVFNCFQFCAHFSAQIPLMQLECGYPDNSNVMTVTYLATGSRIRRAMFLIILNQ